MPERTSTRRTRGSNSGRPRGKSRAPKTDKKPTTNAKPLTPTLDPPDIQSFAEFDLGDEIQQAILDMGITKPTPIQALAIEPVLKGRDIIAKAETGTGKTLAFGAPMMAKVEAGRSTVLGLVLSPTRELAEQVHKVLEELGKARGLKTALIVGGEPLGPQVKQLQAGAQVVVGTPGRVLDLLNQKFLQFPWTEFAILDEADKMLEIGFIDDVKKILDACNEYRRTLLFSATFPPQLLDLARSYTTDPVEIATASGVATVDTINQYVMRCSQEDRAKNLSHLIEDSGKDDVFLVFCERRTDVDQLLRKLERKRFSVKALHGGYDQAARFRVMTAFRTGDVKCLIATDVASRGLDVAHVTHVVNLGLPREKSDYTHRIGRTGRAGRHGTALTMISSRDERDFADLVRHTKFDIEEIMRPRDLFSRERTRAHESNDGGATEAEFEVVEEKAASRPKETSERPRRGRRERTPRREERGQDEEERPRSRRRSERARSEEPSSEESRSPRVERAPDSTEERPERRPRRRRASSLGSERDEPEAAESERPRRRRSRRSALGPAPEGRATERPERTEKPRGSERVGRPQDEDLPEAEARPRRRRRRQRDEGVQPETEAAQESPRRPRAERDDSRDEPTDDRPGGRRPRRARGAAGGDRETSRREKPQRAPEGESSETERRPRRRRRGGSAEESLQVEKSPEESPRKERSGRPKRAPRSENARDDKEAPKRTEPARTPKKPAAGGGFGAGV